MNAYDEIMSFLSPDVRRNLTMALTPEQRGWWTAEEIKGLPGNWIAVTDLSSAEARYIPGRPE